MRKGDILKIRHLAAKNAGKFLIAAGNDTVFQHTQPDRRMFKGKIA